MIGIALVEPEVERLQKARQARIDAIVAAIPPHITGDLRARCARYAAAVVRDCPESELGRVVWPWTPRRRPAATARGRQGVGRVG